MYSTHLHESKRSHFVQKLSIIRGCICKSKDAGVIAIREPICHTVVISTDEDVIGRISDVDSHELVLRRVLVRQEVELGTVIGDAMQNMSHGAIERRILSALKDGSRPRSETYYS